MSTTTETQEETGLSDEVLHSWIEIEELEEHLKENSCCEVLKNNEYFRPGPQCSNPAGYKVTVHCNDSYSDDVKTGHDIVRLFCEDCLLLASQGRVNCTFHGMYVSLIVYNRV